MTPPQASSDPTVRPETCYWSSIDTAQAYADFSDPHDPPFSQRQYANEHGIPRSTLGYWLRQQFPDHLDPEVVDFFRRPVGHNFLRRLVGSTLLVFHHQHPCGLRAVGQFLELAELDYFVGSSYGALYSLDKRLQQNLLLFGQEERSRLAAALAATGVVKDIVLCPDENFHGPHPCLVLTEPVSNFLVAEVYREHRDSVTWVKVIKDGLADLPVHVVCLTSDQASGLLCCAEKELDVQHHPDLMHLQANLGKPILLPLARPISQAKKDLEKLKQEENRLEQLEEERPGSYTVKMAIALIKAQEQAKEELQQAQQTLEEAVEQIREVSRVYHPFDRETGTAVTPEQMHSRLDETLAGLQEVVEEANLGTRAQEAVPKAQGWVVLLVGCLAWFWSLTRQKVEELEVSEEAEQTLLNKLIPGYYWEMASDKEKDPQQRRRLAEMAEQLKDQAWAEEGALAGLEACKKVEVQRAARQCAELFQRSSSCVEGRNSKLSLFHHGQTRLSATRLATLTVVHNYVVRREDGTTAAERFFGHKQRDAFTWLLQRMPELPRPAAKRRKPYPNEPAVAA
jgi:hypothetical protein